MLPNDDLTLAVQLQVKAQQANKEVNDLVNNLRRVTTEATSANAAMDKMAKRAQTQNVKSLNAEIKNLNHGMEQVEPAAKKAGKGLFSLTNFARTAIGTLEAMAIFLISKFVGDAISAAINGVKQLELAFYNLAVAEKTLSNAGVDITPQDFQDIIQSVKDLGLAISDTDITKSVAELATGLQDLGLSKDQLEGLSRAAAIIATAEGLSMENVVDQFAQGIAKGGRGLADLDIQVDAAVIKQKALEEGLVSSEEAWNNLTAAQKQSIETQALYLIIMDSANTKLEELGMLEDSVTMSTKQVSAEWENLTTLLGTVFGPIIIQSAQNLGKLLEFLQKVVSGLGILFAMWVSGAVALAAVLDGVMNGTIRSVEDATQVINTYQKAAFEASMIKMFPNGVPGIDGSPTKPLQPDTPTGTKPAQTLEEDTQDLQKALEKMNDEILEAQLKLQQDMEEAQIDLGRKLVDIATEYTKKRADAEREYTNKVADINASYNSKVRDIQSSRAEANQKARNDELEREAKFQEEMRQLKENFLMSLDDALHERDARQVLRLIKQYELDKAQAERENELEKEKASNEQAERAAKFQREMADAERERKEKLAAAQRDYQDKLAKLAADEAAERAAAELAYQRKKEDLEREMQDRLEIIAANLINEFNLTKTGLDAIVALYQQYYAEVSAIYAAMQHMLGGQLMGSKPNPSMSGHSNSKGNNSVRGGMAQGGSIIANQPTNAVFGEAGPEIATFTPIGRKGTDVNKMFSALSGEGGGASGQLEIGVSLSPDLESRIIKNTMGETAKVISNVRRSKN